MDKLTDVQSCDGIAVEGALDAEWSFGNSSAHSNMLRRVEDKTNLLICRGHYI